MSDMRKFTKDAKCLGQAFYVDGVKAVYTGFQAGVYVFKRTDYRILHILPQEVDQRVTDKPPEQEDGELVKDTETGTDQPTQSEKKKRGRPAKVKEDTE